MPRSSASTRKSARPPGAVSRAPEPRFVRDDGDVIPESEIRVRLESVRVGQMLSFVVCAGSEIYVLATWDQPHRLFLTGIFVFGVLVSALISRLPIERIVS